MGDAEYSHSKVPALNNTIIETILKKMKDDNKNYKYVGKVSRDSISIVILIIGCTQLHVLFYKEQVLDFMLEVLLFGIRIMMVSLRIK